MHSEQEVYSQFNPPVFESITVEDGLPKNSVTCILQDYLGYLWLGTQNGLVQYDGYSMKVFQPEKDNSSRISDGRITTIYEDKNKTLWIGTYEGGLNKFDRANGTFNSFKYNPNDTTSINSDKTHCIYEDKSRRFWIGTFDGLNLFNRDKGTFTRYYFRTGDFRGSDRYILKSNPYNLTIDAITEDPVSGDLLIGTEINGLWKFNIKEKIFSKYKFSSDNNFDKKIGIIQSFYRARDGKIWIASLNTLSSLDPQERKLKSYIDFPIIWNETWIRPNYTFAGVIEDQDGLIWCGFFDVAQGIFFLDPSTGNYLRYDLSPEKPKGASYNKIFTIYEDRSGILWIGTVGAGLMKLDRRKNQFLVLKSDPNNFSNSLSHSLVYSVTYDSRGFIWFCTQRALDKYDIKTCTYKHYLTDEECITKSIYCCFQDKSGYIWLGTNNCGLIRFDPSDGSYRFYLNDPKESLNLINKPIISLLQDHLGILWIGTDGFGLYKYDIANNKVTQYKENPNDPSSLSQDQVPVLFEDSFGILWVGTQLGVLNKFDRRTEKFSYYGLGPMIYEDKQRNFWIEEGFSTLNLFNREKDTIISSFSQSDGLASGYILGILEDDQNNLWISTNIGLSRFNINAKTFRNYYKEDGLPGSFTESNCAKGPDGNMYFNTSGGEIAFHPDSIKDDPTPPQVVLSRVSLFNRPNEKLKYEGFISELKEITLPYDQNDLRFDFVGLHFSAPSRNRYKYILENFNNEWVDAGNQRYATYTNLDPGEYVFRATASNKDGVWNETGVSIILIISPPWWATTWAYIFYVLILGSILYFTWKLQVKRIKIKHEFEMSRFETEKLHEVDEIKSRFFTNISHEFRTPLTLILGPVKQVIEKLNDGKMKDDLSMVHRNANKLLGLVTQLLDISKLESGNMKLQTIPQNIIPLLKALVLSFTSYAERKRITLKFNSSEDEIIVYIDTDKIEKIITNILSNAFKFTPDGGTIAVTLKTDERNLNISTIDTGVGIPKEKISKIFDRFYQVDGSHTREQEGTGIGLSLTKELVELHRGKIEIESEEGKVTTVTISIPLGKEHLKPEEILEPVKVAEGPSGFADKASEPRQRRDEVSFAPKKSIYVDETKTDLSVDKAGKFDLNLITDTEKQLLLIVEDNSDVRNYIKDNLIKDYRILEAIDGEDGWNKSIEQTPDLIVIDVMMPKMDGFQLCKKLKTDERTSHIPVILLTAKAAKEDKLEGYETGADAYMMKPFEPDELRARIRNLIEQRKRLHEHFQKQGVFELNQTKITSVDKKFLQKAFDRITDHISDSSFSVELLVEGLAISRSVLHRKILSLTGETPGELIRRIRLNKAADLIKQKFGNLSEIALEVGFNNPAYFSESFKKQFGVAPSQFQQNIKS
jgi:signal transduction histidine kinase/ligand-binding sensor domain-containing protein/DNA-binding response OmpR family regulator